MYGLKVLRIAQDFKVIAPHERRPRDRVLAIDPPSVLSGPRLKARRHFLQLQLMPAISHLQLSAGVAPNVHSCVVA
jgi:hypothetical protein